MVVALTQILFQACDAPVAAQLLETGISNNPSGSGDVSRCELVKFWSGIRVHIPDHNCVIMDRVINVVTMSNRFNFFKFQV